MLTLVNWYVERFIAFYCHGYVTGCFCVSKLTTIHQIVDEFSRNCLTTG